MCKAPYGASNRCKFDRQILNYLDVHDHLAMWHAYKMYQLRKLGDLQPLTVPSPIVSVIGPSVSHGLEPSIKIAQAPHHWALPIEPVIKSRKIPALTSSVCHWLDLGSYDGSSVGHQWDYNIQQLLVQYQFLDIWDHF